MSLLGCALALGLGCQPEEATLLKLDSCSPHELEEGTVFRVFGAELPAGHEGRLRLEGEVARPGAWPIAVELTLPIEARSNEELTLTLGRQELRQLGGRGTFKGSLRASFPTADGQGRVAGELSDVTLDMLGDIETDAGLALSRRQEANRFREALGLALSEDSPTLRVQEVAEGSPAARAGLQPDDELIAIDGLRLANATELLPRPQATEALLSIRRSEGRRSLAIPIVWAPQKAETDTATRWWIALLTFSSIIWLWLGPLADPLSRIGFPRDRGSLGANQRLNLLLGAIASALGLGAVGLVTANAVLGDLRVLGALACALLVAAGLLRRDGRPWRLLARLGAIALALAAGALLAEGTTASSISAAQAAAPWQWLVSRQPLAWPALLALLLAMRGGDSTHESPPPAQAASLTTTAAHVFERAALLLMSALAALLFVGGGTASRPDADVWELVGFVARAGLLLWLAPRLPRQLGLAFAMSLLAVVAASYASSLVRDGALETTIGVASSALWAAIALLIVRGRWRPDDRRTPPTAHLFL